MGDARVMLTQACGSPSSLRSDDFGRTWKRISSAKVHCRPRTPAPRWALAVVSKPVIDGLRSEIQSLCDVLHRGALFPRAQDCSVLQPIEGSTELCDRLQGAKGQFGVLGAAKKGARERRGIHG